MFELRTMLLGCTPLPPNSREHMICLELETNDFQMMTIRETLSRLTAMCPQSLAKAALCVRGTQTLLPRRTGREKSKQDLRGLSSGKADQEIRIPPYHGHAPATCIVLSFPLSPIYSVAQTSALPCQSLKAKKRITN